MVVIGHWHYLPLKTIEKLLLEQDIADPDTLKVLDKAMVRIPDVQKRKKYSNLLVFQVPIVKIVDKKTKIRVDISFNKSSGIRVAELIKHYKKVYPPLSKLTYVLKQFLHQRDLNEVRALELYRIVV